ncbi:hypothetical protein AYX15_05707 [Cryptococcus neoformans]|nr:hypothetical protein AYX15_05707 [Cryptococcus neoformans var. grubii]
MFFQVQWAKKSALRVPLPLLTPPSSFVKRLGGFDTRQLLLQKRVSRHQLLIDFFKLKRGCECADILLSDGMIVHAKSAEVVGGKVGPQSPVATCGEECPALAFPCQ